MDPWGILNLLVDHHKKGSDETRSSKNSCNSSWSIQLTNENSTQSDEWHQNIVALTCTILSDVFLMKITSDIDFMRKDLSDCSNCHDCTVKIPQFLDHFQEPTQSPVLHNDRKRPLSSSPIYHKRAKLALNSTEDCRLVQKSVFLRGSISLPTTIQCEATYKLWEGRRKARRQISQPGLSDILDLERQVSRLLMSDQSEISISADANTSSLSGCSTENSPTDFSFNLNFIRSENNSINMYFRLLSGPERDFLNFFHHIQIFLPKLIKKSEAAV